MAFLTKSLPRRTLLKGIGTTLALPFLDAMLPPLRAATTPRAPFPGLLRAQRHGHGILDAQGRRHGARAKFPSWSRWPPYKDQMLVFSGIKASWNYIHAGASGSFLTGTPRGGRNEIEIIADVSIDQLLGQHFAQGNATGVARDLHGPARQCGRLHRQSELRLPRHALLAEPHAAACRWSGIRARFSRSCSAIAAARTASRARSRLAAAQEHSGLGQRQAGEPQAGTRAAGSGQDE